MNINAAAFLWDESFLWGLMAYKALSDLNLPFTLVTADDIKNGCLDHCGMLFVPGGWASNKSKALGERGIKAIQEFVANGGSYLGFCGGAGLATQAREGLGLLNVTRRPTMERVPSFSGSIQVNIQKHPIWHQLTERPVFNAWWPSQLIVEDSGINVLASYGRAMADSFSSDLNVGDVEDNGNWEELEEMYRINLNPARLINEPSVIEGVYGKGRVILSLVHFDTPGDSNGQQVLLNLWGYLTDCRTRSTEHRMQTAENRDMNTHSNELLIQCSDLISLGERNFLWFWRNPMLLQWRRGVRGLEYNTLYIMMKEIASQYRSDGTQSTGKQLSNIEALLVPFIEKAKRLLIFERHALQKGHITYERCADPEIKEIRSELFSESKSHGGMFKSLIDEVDAFLLALIKAGDAATGH